MFLCPNKVAVIQIATSDGEINDDFDVFINDQYVGPVYMGGPTSSYVRSSFLIGKYGPSFVYVPDGYYTYTIDQTDLIHFSNEILVSGTNNIRLENINDNNNGNEIYIIIRLYDVENNQLVSPTWLETISLVGDTGDSFSSSFELACSLPVLYEFDPTFEVDTGNLNQVFSGSGVHSKKDVTFFFGVLDQQANLIATNQDFVENPLVEGIVFDILDISGNTVSPNYFSGKSATSITISELDNERVFGSYQKDFGVRIKVPNSFDASTFTGEFYAYGNVPNIIDVLPSNFSGTYIDNILEISEELPLRVFLQNGERYVKIDRYDIYGSTGQDIQLSELTYLNPEAQSGYLYSQPTTNLDNIYNINIKRGNLDYNQSYYFTIVAYSELGSGLSYSFGPVVFSLPAEVAVSNNLDGASLRLFDGLQFSQASFATGVITSGAATTTKLDEFSSDNFSTAKYLTEITNHTGFKTSSELKTVINSNDVYLVEETVNNTGQAIFYIEQFGTGCSLYVSGITGGGTFKIHKTLI